MSDLLPDLIGRDPNRGIAITCPVCSLVVEHWPAELRFRKQNKVKYGTGRGVPEAVISLAVPYRCQECGFNEQPELIRERGGDAAAIFGQIDPKTPASPRIGTDLPNAADLGRGSQRPPGFVGPSC